MTQEEQVISFMHQLENPWVLAGFILLMIWALIWKGFALWKASTNGSKPWFIAILVLNTYGILEIIYIFYFSKKKNKENPGKY
jgi:hypothetical protein